jgi:small-conductance mechanosensitive channel
MLDLTWWQMFALLGTAAVAVFGGRLIGRALHRMVYRRVLLTRTTADDRFVLRLAGPIEASCMVVVWQVLVSFIQLPAGVMTFCRSVGHIGLLLALAWGALRMIDTGLDVIGGRSTWVTNQRVSRSLLPLARRIAKGVLALLVGVMVLARLGYSVGPLLVLLAIVGGAVALAAHRPLENVLAAYAILGDHGIREGDTVRIYAGGRAGSEADTIGTIEAIGLYSTRLRTLSGSNLIVPNRRLADAQIERSFTRAPTPTRPIASVAETHHSSLGGLL